MGIALSIVIPAYNEAKRLPPYLESVRGYLDGRYPGDYEVIVVDDGSSDDLAAAIGPVAEDWPPLCVMRHEVNRGKGAAVRTGMLAAGGERLLFADADGATPIEEEARLARAMDDGADVAVGSRLVPGEGVTRRRSLKRAVVGRLFAAVARWWLRIPVRDTQCGFKMFRAEAGRKLFSRITETGYLFDLELLALAGRLGYTIAEVPVNWSDIPGGHLSVTGDLTKILRALHRLRKQLRNPPDSESSERTRSEAG